MNIDSLKSFPQWVCFTPAKKPVNPQTGYGAKANDASTWASYDQARKRWASDKGQYAGIGYEFRKEQKITGVDLDKCIDEEGNITPWARAIVERLNSYTEYSPSGRGLHIWVQGEIPENIGPDLTGITRIEMYDHERYFTVTGNRLPGTPETIEPRQDELALLYREVMQARKEAKEKARQASSNGLDTKYGLKALETERKELAGSPNGTRNAQLNRAAYALGQLVAGNELTRATVEQALTDAARACGLDDREIEKTLASGLEKGMESPRSAPAEQAPTRNSYPCTDLGNAERFAARYAKRARWCETWNCWMIFNGKCWEKDRCGRVDQFAKMTTRAIYKEAADESDDQARAKLAKHASNSESNRSIRAMLDRAKSELPVLPEAFNVQLHLLNCNNGTLDLRNGQLAPHNPDDMLTRCIKIDYNPLATAPQWYAFVASIFAGDTSLIDFVQMGLGMSLSGDIREQCWFLCHGAGSNGKTTLLEIPRAILNDYALAANIDSFQARKGERINNDVAEFYGARFITASENQVGTRLNEAFIKKITGSEPLRARRLHENEFQFMPECTIWLSVNHKPVVKDTSKGMWRRVHYIPFNVTFDDSQIDKDLPKKLLQEAEGILAWLVAGCIAWYQNGRLTVPETVKEATKIYQDEQDTIGRFIREECIINPDRKIFTQDLNERFELWCAQNNEKVDTKALKDALNIRGFHSKRSTGGKWVYKGFALTPMDSDGSDGSDGERGVNSRGSDASEKKGEVPSPTITTVTNSENEEPQGDVFAKSFVETFCAQLGHTLRVQDDQIIIGVPESMSDEAYERIAATIMQYQDQIKTLLALEVQA
jgi:putative DNA primase/helicase